jgi:hypothetical protein
VTDLFAADLQRILWRPMTRAIGGLGIVVAVALGVIMFLYTAHHPFATRKDLGGAMTNAMLPLAFACYTLGASTLGADYTSRALTTLLTWEPRRRLVLASRACACALITAGLTVIVLLTLVLALLPSAVVHGVGNVRGGAWYLSIAALTLRCALLTATMSIIGVAAAAIGRSTAAAVIGIVGYLVLIEYTAVQAAPSFARWLLFTDASSWVGYHTTVGAPAGHTVVTGGLLLASGTAALCALATRTFERRDVT